MQSETAKMRLCLAALTKLSFLLLINGNAVAQQSVEDNIRPSGQVCLTGQPCVGSTASRATVVVPVAEVVVEPATAVQAEVVEETTEEPAAAVQAEVVEETTEEPVAIPAAAAQAAVAEPVVAAFDVESTYQMSCFACHGTGAAAAPKLDDQDAWAERLAKGMDAVMANVLNGVNAMPARGLCMTCSDDDLRRLVDYMISQ